MKHLIVINLVLALAVTGSALVKFVVLPNQDSAASVGREPSADLVIHYTNAGFEPAHVSAKVFDRVAFVNDTDRPLQVVSDPLELHTDYPGFNSPSAHPKGIAHRTTLLASGAFGFHNALVPSDFAVVDVEDPTHPSPDIHKTPSDQRSLLEEALAGMKADDPGSIRSIFAKIAASETLANNCHSIAHDIGHQAYQWFGFSRAMEAVKPTTAGETWLHEACAGGYVHGVLEALSIHKNDLVDSVGELCRGLPLEAQDGCFHGVGHAVLFHNDMDLKKAVSDCSTLVDATQKQNCLEGVYMELFWGATPVDQLKKLGYDLKTPLVACARAPEEAKKACYLYAIYGFLRTTYKDYPGAVSLCANSGLGSSDQADCLRGIGMAMIAHFRGVDLERSEVFVRGLSNEQKVAFYRGMIRFGVYSGIKRSEFERVCGALAADQPVCSQVLTEI